MKQKRRRSRVALLSLGIMATLSLPAYAEETLYQLDEVVVTATRTEQKIKDTPASVEVITRQDIETLGADTVAEALKMATNLNLDEVGAMVGNAVSMRGLPTRHTLILVDGRRIAGEDTESSQNFYELNRLKASNVERIEVVRGPVSSLYGSDALGGVINIITKVPDKQQFSLHRRYGTRQNNTGFSLDSGKTGKWNWSGSFDTSDIKFYRMHGDNSNQFGTRKNYNITGVYDIDASRKLKVYANRMEEDLQEIYYTTTDNDYWDNRRKEFGVKYEGKDNRGNYEFEWYYNQLEKDTVGRSRYTGATTGLDYAKYDTWVLQGRRSLLAGDNHLLTYGAEYRDVSYAGTRVGTGKGSFTVTKGNITKAGSKATGDYYAFYVQDEWTVNDKLLLIPSLRYDGSSKFGNEISPKISGTYKLNDNSRLKASAAKGYRAPSFSDLYMDFVKTPVSGITVKIYGNPELKPEKSDSYEISFEAEKGKNFGKVTYFYNDVKDFIDYQIDIKKSIEEMALVHQYVNLAAVRVQGTELEAGRKLSNKLTLTAAYAHLDAIDKTTGLRLKDRIKDKVTVRLDYNDMEKHGISAMLWNDWMMDYLIGTPKGDVTGASNYSFALLNLAINKKINDNYSVSFGVDNILDKKLKTTKYSSKIVDGTLWRAGVMLTF